MTDQLPPLDEINSEGAKILVKSSDQIVNNASQQSKLPLLATQGAFLLNSMFQLTQLNSITHPREFLFVVAGVVSQSTLLVVSVLDSNKR